MQLKVRIITKSDWLGADAMPILRKLQRLPIGQRIISKMAVFTFKVRSTTTPKYLVSLLQLNFDTGRTLRSSRAPRLFVPRARTEATQRAFIVAAPNVWNPLPDSVRLNDSITTFRRRLKTNMPFDYAPL
jgi:hypothetical protein